MSATLRFQWYRRFHHFRLEIVREGAHDWNVGAERSDLRGGPRVVLANASARDPFSACLAAIRDAIRTAATREVSS